MVKSLILLGILAFSLPALAQQVQMGDPNNGPADGWQQQQQVQDGGQYVKDWWNNVYEQRIESQNYQAIKQRNDSRCDTKIEWYQQKVDEDPTSEYFQYKLESWIERCQ